jgi:hypothetical protein
VSDHTNRPSRKLTEWRLSRYGQQLDILPVLGLFLNRICLWVVFSKEGEVGLRIQKTWRVRVAINFFVIDLLSPFCDLKDWKFSLVYKMRYLNSVNDGKREVRSLGKSPMRVPHALCSLTQHFKTDIAPVCRVSFLFSRSWEGKSAEWCESLNILRRDLLWESRARYAKILRGERGSGSWIFPGSLHQGFKHRE